MTEDVNEYRLFAHGKKRFFTQVTCMLTDGTTSMAQMKEALEAGGFPVLQEALLETEWPICGPSVTISYTPRTPKMATIDLVDLPWPDSMGVPKSNPSIFPAWGMGHFGPFAFPNSLQRARDQCWHWKEGSSAAGSHRGFIRIRLSNLLGSIDSDEPHYVYDPREELVFLNTVTLALFRAPGVICHFNPNGEVLYSADQFTEICRKFDRQREVPLLLWTNVRLFTINANFLLMDTAGNGQLDLPDLEAVFQRDSYDCNAVAYHLRNVTHYLLDSGRALKHGESIDGPGESDLTWGIEEHENGLVSPPRGVIRLMPKAQAGEIHDAIAALHSDK